MARILVLNGPNLDRLGDREPERYGYTSLDEIIGDLEARAEALGHQLEHFQSNAEHELIDALHRAADQDTDFLLFNPAAFTHTSIALRDAVLAAAIPMIEIHLSNPAAREPFRQQSFFSDIAAGVISGLGARGYVLALDAAHARLQTRQDD